MTIVRLTDIRSVSYCSRGARAWFDRYGLDWRRFLSEGLPAEDILATGCAMGAAAVKAAEQREAAEHGQ